MQNELKIDWHQTKGLSISIILLLLVNITSTVWWAATLTNDVNQIKGRPELTERVIRLEAVSDAYNNILTRLILVMDKMEATVNRIDREQVKTSNNLENHIRKDKKR